MDRGFRGRQDRDQSLALCLILIEGNLCRVPGELAHASGVDRIYLAKHGLTDPSAGTAGYCLTPESP